MPETDSGNPYITRVECASHINHFNDKLMDIGDDVEGNAKTNERILKILQGNGEGGLIFKVNSLIMRSQWLDKAFSVLISIISTLITLWIAGVLHL